MFCQKCGTELNQESVFCPKCGHKLNDPAVRVFLPSTMGVRFLNRVLDIVGFFIICFIAGLIIGIFSGLTGTDINYDSVWFNIMIYTIMPLYYIFFESIWQSTPGKWITKTKVVLIDGTKPGFSKILVRTISRFIPFDNFSFLFNNTPRGWHDRISKTLVVPASYTVDDVKNIDVKNIKSNDSKLGIIIAAIFVFIFVVGILAAVVLASLNEAKEKAKIKMDEAKMESSIVNTSLE
jgi:uncharacterized RDD family membrane protein YckC